MKCLRAGPGLCHAGADTGAVDCPDMGVGDVWEGEPLGKYFTGEQ